MKNFSLTAFLLFSLMISANPDPTVVSRCGAETSKGTTCKMIVKKQGDKCHHHDGSVSTLTCGAMTSKKKPCKMKVMKQGDRCRHHQ